MKSSIVSNFELFQILWWFKWRTLPLKKWQILSIIVSPSLFCLGFVFIRFHGQNSHHEHPVGYMPIDLKKAWNSLLVQLENRKKTMDRIDKGFEYNAFVPRLIVGYAPSKFPGFVKIMNHAAPYLHPAKMVSYADCETLRTRIISQNYIAGVCFDNTSMDATYFKIHFEFPSSLGITLIYPSKLRIYNDTYIGNVWNTGRLFPSSHDQRYPSSNDGGYMGYIREGFLSLQNAIAISYIQLTTKQLEMPNIFMQRFPTSPVNFEHFESAKYTFPLIIWLGYLGPLAILMKMLFDENGDKIKMASLRLIGITKWIIFWSWLTSGIILLFLASSLRILLFRIFWTDYLGLLQRTPISVSLFYLTSYSVSMLCFCFMLYTIFSESKFGTVLSVLILFASASPSLNTVYNENQSTVFTMLNHLLPNSVMALSFLVMLQFDNTVDGLNWHSMFDAKSIDSECTFGFYIILLWVLSIIYSTIGLYMQYIKTTPLIRKIVDSQNDKKSSEKCKSYRYYNADRHMTRVYQIKSSIENRTVQLKNVTKKYNGRIAIENLTLSLHSGEIAVLIGHNGAGKTSLLYLLADVTSPTKGAIYFDQYLLSDYVELSPKNAFVCMGNEILFKDLTAYDQLRFYCLIKGLSFNESKLESRKYLSAMKLYDNRTVLTRNLSFGLKKSLAVCCALIGGSKIVILDEPSSGMDLFQRELFWVLLNQEKNGRTILLTSHSVGEAEKLGDRVLVMANGQLKCDGSPFFLKSIYGAPMRLVCTKQVTCETVAVTSLLQKIIPHITPEYELGTELSYIIPNKHIEKIPEILKILEINYSSLGIERCATRQSPIEDTILRMGSDDSAESDRFRYQQITIGETIYSDEYDNLEFVKAYDRPTPIRLWLIQIRLTLWKHWLYNWNNKTLLAIQFLIPVFIVVQVFAVRPRHANAEKLDISLQNYSKSFTVLEYEEHLNNFSSSLVEILETIPYRYDGNHNIELSNGQSFQKFMLNKFATEEYRVNKRYLVGATIKNKSITAWFNNYPLHTAPLSLAMIHGNMIRAHVNPNSRFRVTLELLPHKSADCSKLTEAAADYIMLLIYRTGLAFCFIWPLSVVYLVEEQHSQQKLLQIISGLHISAFWIGTFCSDILRIFCVLLITWACVDICDLMADSHQQYLSLQIDLIRVIMYISCCALPLNYLIALFFEDGTSAYLLITCIHTFFVCLYILPNVEYCNDFICHSTSTICLETPHYALMSIVTKIIRLNDMKLLCSIPDVAGISENLEKCNLAPWCCGTATNPIQHSTDVRKDVYISYICAIIHWTLIGFIEMRHVYHRGMLFRRTPKDNIKSAFIEHSNFHSENNKHLASLIHEKAKLNRLTERTSKEKSLVCDTVYKRHNRKVIVDRTYLIVERGEIFGFTGTTGCGKSTLLKLIVGAEKLTFGRILMNGESVHKNLFKMYEHIGYCSQNDHLPAGFRVTELMMMFCMLNGMSKQLSNVVCINLAKVLGFFSYYNEEFQICSTGIQRRISFAIALVGNPSIIYVDEPFCFLDPAGTRILRNILCKLKRFGKTIILSTISTRECEILCDRVSVMYKGCHLYIGNPFALSGKRITDYSVFLFKKGTKLHGVLNYDYEIERFFINEFHRAVIYCQLQHLIKVVIPSQNLFLADVFEKIETTRSQLNIENFTVSRALLFNFIMNVANEGNN